MGGYASGILKRKVTAYRWQGFLDLCLEAQKEGYRLHKAKYRTQWPFFWIRKYTAHFRKNFVWAGGDVAFYDPNDIEAVKNQQP